MLWGREAEMVVLADSLRTRRPTVLVGPAGVGKSALAQAALAELGPFIESGALATLRWSPMLVFRRLLAHTLSDDPAEVASEVLRNNPGGLLLDDLQWADDLSLGVTQHLVDRLPLLATVRSTDPRAARTLECLNLVGFELLEVHPLGPDSSLDVLDAAGPGLSRDRRAEVLRVAAGNPLLLVELAASEHDSPTLLQVLLDRMADLSSDAREAMERLSVLGRPAEAELLGAGASELVESGLAGDSEGLVRVRHDLLAEVAVEDLGERADALRRQLAKDVEHAEGAFLLAEAGERAQARALALSAASAAPSGKASAADRAELLCLAVTLAPEGDLDAENRVAAARALTWCGRPERALELAMPEGVELLPPIHRGTLRAVAAEAAWGCSRGRFPELIELALADLSGTDTVAEVEVLAGSTLVATRIEFDGRPVVDRARAAVALADHLGVKRGFARARLGSVLMTSGNPEWVRHYREAVALARDEGDHWSEVVVAEGLVLGQWLAGSVDDAKATAEALFLAGPVPNHRYGWLSNASHAAVVSLAAGSDRDQLIERWLPILAEEPSYRNREYAEAAVALALADLGRHDEAADLLAGVADRPQPKPEDASLICWARAETAYMAGRAEDAASAVAAAEMLGIPGFPPLVGTRLIGGYLAREAGELPSGDGPLASVPGWEAAQVEWLGLVASAEGRHEDAVGLLDDAVVRWRGHDRRLEVRAQWAAGDSARLAGRDDATSRLKAAEAQAVRYQVGDVAARCRWSLRLLGVGRGSPRDAGGTLTARQQHMLQRVGSGLTTAAIAAELHVAPSTVDSTLREAVRRLGAPNRRAAAAMLSVLD